MGKHGEMDIRIDRWPTWIMEWDNLKYEWVKMKVESEGIGGHLSSEIWLQSLEGKEKIRTNLAQILGENYRTVSTV